MSLAAPIEVLSHLTTEHGPPTVGADVIGRIARLLVAVLAEAGATTVHVPDLAVNRARHGTAGSDHRSTAAARLAQDPVGSVSGLDATPSQRSRVARRWHRRWPIGFR